MKKISIFLASLFLIGSLILISFWIGQPKKHPEVIKIYKVVPYEPKPLAIDRVQNSTPTTAKTSSEVSHQTEGFVETIQSDLPAQNRTSIETTMQEALDEQLVSLEDHETTNAFGNAPEEEMDNQEIPEWKLYNLVKSAYELQDILNDYDIDIDSEHGGWGVCPLCSGDSFQVAYSARTGRASHWGCHNCNGGKGGTVIEFYDFIDLIAKVERIDRYQAMVDLAESAGLE